MTSPLLAVDAPALLHRAFHALPESIADGDGRPVNALLGSVNQILWCVERYAPRAVVLCFGAEGAAYRIAAYPDYHAKRPELPDGLADQWGRAPGLYEVASHERHGMHEVALWPRGSLRIWSLSFAPGAR